MENNKKYCLITGATSGIGLELAKIFASNKHNLILVARNLSELTRVKSILQGLGDITIINIQKDLFEPSAARGLYQEVIDKGLTVDILVNDAGQGQFGKFVENDIDRYLDIIQLNISSLTVLTNLFLKDMVYRNEGKVLNLASIASEVPGPWQAVYHASKAYVLSLTEALINEVQDTEVTITALQPGVTNTDFFNKADMMDSKAVQDTDKMANPANVARDGYEALMRGKQKIVSGTMNKIQTVLGNIVPDSLLAEQVNKQQEPVKK